MPAGPSGERHSLFGGTPYMFSPVTSEQVMEALRFLNTWEDHGNERCAKQSIEDGMQVFLKRHADTSSIKPGLTKIMFYI